ncbi:hypothetical protein JQU17_20160 [Ponticoccus sp. SC2-23]|uniref:hypothetical protein n=1 Tax=Alexandriicola marinus TaxID=2081710 RepID=UPI000FD6EE2E|nr:hypothetical protein [Alexandriicola marinus]MBM1222530.1 hypothetical protein [Ponticoccus sp. SC6-9]MBM1227036.1 hypothetical protein [Ponticoccus sp. SC6-15]MBM1231457.1 hypothetical protein [Ponticoccus sp. SC6-38]MBM1236107.1 hypothetical protein [Ponticoccus sp. SC6-45]MBM1240480.1 hypothetical protein [Ponticoccus sp. SC6-49]MBM1245015.1 hypothetical protein [Ponticoccus sp. SC2-64]MBM1249582.1 hypothetical protein [Ponticoccus sp. SC6-42]MBM1253973.1 hypothetical protein [Pontico
MAIMKILTNRNADTDEVVVLPKADIVSMYLNKENVNSENLSRVQVDEIPQNENGMTGYLIRYASLSDVDHMTKCKGIMKDMRVYTYFLSRKYVGYAEIEDGSSNIGWFMRHDQPCRERLRSELSVFSENQSELKPFKVVSPRGNVPVESVMDVVKELNEPENRGADDVFKFFARDPLRVDTEMLLSSLQGTLDFEKEIEERFRAGFTIESLRRHLV